MIQKNSEEFETEVFEIPVFEELTLDQVTGGLASDVPGSNVSIIAGGRKLPVRRIEDIYNTIYEPFNESKLFTDEDKP